MGRFRFSIAALLLVVLGIGVAVAALRASTDAWDGGVFGVTLLALLTAVLLAVHRRGRRRAYWLGFALFGWAYLAASLIPPVEARLPTTKGLAYLDSTLPGRDAAGEKTVLWLGPPQGNRSVTSVVFSPDGSRLAIDGGGTIRLWDAATGLPVAGRSGTGENFARIGHSLMAQVTASLGGLLSRSLQASGIGPGEGGAEIPAPPAPESMGGCPGQVPLLGAGNRA